MRDRIRIKETNGHLLIWVKWRSGYAAPLITTVVAALFAVVFAVSAARASGLVPGIEDEASIVQLVTNLIILCMISYVLAAYWINATVIDVCTLDLRVYAGPLPFPYPRRKRIPASQIRQLYVVRSCASSEGGHTSIRFHLFAELTDGSTLELIRHFGTDAKEIAGALEEKIETFLAIEDAHVDGEYRD